MGEITNKKESKMLFCKKCQRYKGFYDFGDKYVCCCRGCKFEIKNDK